MILLSLPNGPQYLYLLTSDTLSKIFLMWYLFLRGRKTEWSRGGAGREADTESEAGSRLRAVSMEPDAGLALTNREIMT